jgi:hypothetical protein
VCVYSITMGNKRENKRMARIREVEVSVKAAMSANKVIDKKKLISVLSYDFGCSRRTATEYIQVLVDAERIEI